MFLWQEIWGLVWFKEVTTNVKVFISGLSRLGEMEKKHGVKNMGQRVGSVNTYIFSDTEFVVLRSKGQSRTSSKREK